MMSGPELPYKISSSEEALACLRRITKIIDDWRDDLRLNLNEMHQRNQTMLRIFRPQMQPQAVSVSDFSILTKSTSRNIVVSYDLAPDTSAALDSVRAYPMNTENFCSQVVPTFLDRFRS